MRSPAGQCTGDESLIERVRYKLSRSYGAFGHGINNATSAIDLHFALRGEDFKEYNPQMTEGAGIVKSYDPEIPKGGHDISRGCVQSVRGFQ